MFDVAISFAGEDRAVAEGLNFMLKANGVSVFYDTDYRSQLWGANLTEVLHSVYYSDASLCLMLLSQHYKAKIWTNHERRSALARQTRDQGDYILPIILDDCTLSEFPGINPDLGYVKKHELCESVVVPAIKQKLGVVDAPLWGAEYLLAGCYLLEYLWTCNPDSTDDELYASMRKYHYWLHGLRTYFSEKIAPNYYPEAAHSVWEGASTLIQDMGLMYIAHRGLDGYTVALTDKAVKLIEKGELRSCVFDWFQQKFGFPMDRGERVTYSSRLHR